MRVRGGSYPECMIIETSKSKYELKGIQQLYNIPSSNRANNPRAANVTCKLIRIQGNSRLGQRVLTVKSKNRQNHEVTQNKTVYRLNTLEYTSKKQLEAEAAVTLGGWACGGQPKLGPP